MDADGIREVFAEIMPVRVRRMFGGHGIYDGETMFALEAGGEIYLKVDTQTESHFVAVGAAPFTYSRNGEPFAMSYWRLPDEAFDDGEALRAWTALALAAARRVVRPVRRRASPVRARLP
ncbi:TfoX/Sxy family protein [Bosea sp. PAMC 26642]|uniref:TfoX/Sxy family protein n=1 Tax=Bosea sp. (strain PAMC 26642) TaxID=1792307 RepID=UPI00077035BC|nr:TfoX/Sxy family protein [Bosea sp. PAMC 26642]AMJ60187.1 hypothetical protein AXW83_07650 [Bosea sp. PAMC 26642]